MYVRVYVCTSVCVCALQSSLKLPFPTKCVLNWFWDNVVELVYFGNVVWNWLWEMCFEGKILFGTAHGKMRSYTGAGIFFCYWSDQWFREIKLKLVLGKCILKLFPDLFWNWLWEFFGFCFSFGFWFSFFLGFRSCFGVCFLLCILFWVWVVVLYFVLGLVCVCSFFLSPEGATPPAVFGFNCVFFFLCLLVVFGFNYVFGLVCFICLFIISFRPCDYLMGGPCLKQC